MDPDGNIYDMQGNFIGQANTNEIPGGDGDNDGGDHNDDADEQFW